MKCEKCEIDYPTGLVRTLLIGRLSKESVGGVDTIDVCGICALEIINQIHGVNNATFHAPKAEQVRLACVKYRNEQGLNKETH